MEKEFEQLNDLIDQLADKADSSDYDVEETEALYYKCEEALQSFEADNYLEIDLSDLKQRMKDLKEQLDIYDPEAELDMMFPNRHDDDFDEDEISGESFFKD